MMDPSFTVVFRTDAAPAIGYGHLARCLALAEEVKARKGRPVFVLGSPHGGSAVRERGFELAGITSPSGTPGDLEVVRGVAQEVRASACLVDGYAFRGDYYAAAAKLHLPVVALSDTPHTTFPVDLLVNPNFGAESLRYRCRPDTKKLLGPMYAPLRAEFRRPAPRTPPVAERPRVLFTFGASDPTRATCRVLRRMPVGFEMDVTCVLGPAYADDGELEGAVVDARRMGHQVRLLRSVKDMAAVMSRVDAAVTAAGSTLYELAALSVPVLAFAVAHNQEPGLRALGRSGVLMNGGSLARLPDESVTCLLRRFVLDRAGRRERAAAFRRLVDGEGAARIVTATWELAAERRRAA